MGYIGSLFVSSCSDLFAYEENGALNIIHGDTALAMLSKRFDPDIVARDQGQPLLLAYGNAGRNKNKFQSLQKQILNFLKSWRQVQLGVLDVSPRRLQKNKCRNFESAAEPGQSAAEHCG